MKFMILCKNCNSSSIAVDTKEAKVECFECGYVGSIQESTFYYEDFANTQKVTCPECKQETPKVVYCGFCGHKL